MNTNINIFEYASRNKFRYPYKGTITTEDLWDLSPEQLDVVYKALNKEASEVQEESLMCTMDDTDYDLLMKIDIVKHVFTVKEQEAENRKNEAVKAAKKQHILELLEKKRENTLMNMSEDELMQMLNNLG